MSVEGWKAAFDKKGDIENLKFFREMARLLTEHYRSGESVGKAVVEINRVVATIERRIEQGDQGLH